MRQELGNLTVKAEIQKQEPDTVQSLHDVVDRYESLKHGQKEHLYAVFLTNGNRFIGDKIIGLGSRDTVEIDIQDVVRTAALTNAGAVILVHNHPSGKPGATAKDIEVTREAREVLEKINVELLDHVIISRESHYSMRRANDGPF
ncbi:JAB domain-containing protein [Halobellus clavatus]|uniref:RadC-like JAB domain-containing protein n=1 Tax=Halobellus clavatus TaxID=660517 RepID=A0A1H3DG91_9EURY|nr:JAB domain-containing protein [Halobellus clavatus]SDX65381.1 RadC-like JAB domain-containing protein [Halobellus clavatus]